MSDAQQPWPLIPSADIGPVPTEVAAALTLVLADMQPPAPVPIAVGWTPGDADDWSTLLIRDTTDQTTAGIPIYGTDHESLLEQIADHLQDQFFPETTSAWGQARPSCPGHPHPCEVRLRQGRAWWQCPTSRSWIARVGTMAD